MTAPQIAVAPLRPLGLAPSIRRLRALLEEDGLAIVVIAAWTSVLVFSMQRLVVEDTFLALVDGRLIARHGLPHVDTLTYWTLGRPWTDQQWGAHLVFYELGRYGGVHAAVLLGIGCVATALVVAGVATRTLGSSPRSAAIALLLPLVCSSWLAEVRTQSLALTPFMIVYALLALDARRPGRRVLLVLPLLVLWANLHGSVVLAAGLSALYGLTLLRLPVARARALLLVVGAPLCVLASPYGVDLTGYYRMMLVSPPFAEFIQEWRPPVVGIATAPFFVSVLALAALWWRHRRALTSFERWAIVLLALGAMMAVRNAVWFELAAVVSLPRLLDAAWPSGLSPTAGVRRSNIIIASCSVALTGLVVAAQSARTDSWLLRGRSPEAAAAVAAAAGPHGIVLADDEHADWLLWEQPSLAGRVAYDVRFELFDQHELLQIRSLLLASRTTWRRCGVTARVVTFAYRADRRQAVRQGVLAHGFRPLTRDGAFSAVVQPPAATSCPRL